MKLIQSNLALKLSSALLVGGLVLLPQAAGAQTDADSPTDTSVGDEAAQITSIAVFGTGITLSVEVDGSGNLTTVELFDASGAVPTDAVATDVSPHKVKFEIADGATRVEVKAEEHKIESKIKVNELADLVGSHTWTGELFGPGNGVTEVVFTVTDDGGVPVIELVSVTGPGAYADAVHTEFDDDEIESKLRIEAVDSEGNEARIDIEVEVELDDDDDDDDDHDDDDDRKAKLKISIRSDLYDDDRYEDDEDEEDDHDDANDPTVNTPIDDRDDEDDDDHDDDEEDDHDDDDDDDRDHDDDEDDDDHDDEDEDEDGEDDDD